MKKIAFFLLFSAIILTFVAVAVIPQIIIPEDYGSGFVVKKGKAADIEKTLPDKASPADAGSCDLSVFNMDCGIARYLEENLIDPKNSGNIFCAYEKIGQSESGDIIYLNYACAEFYLSSGKIRGGSGQAGPAKITKLDNGTLSHFTPRAGNYFNRDVNEFFPKEYRQAALNPNLQKLALINRERAKTGLSADFGYKIEKDTGVACAHDFECVTPAEYLLQSRCPFASICNAGKCTVVCPETQN